jgi:CRISPR-associated protein Cmr6
MNAFWALTKNSCPSESSSLYQVVRSKGDEKRQLFKKILRDYARGWSPVPDWYKKRFSDYYSALPEGHHEQFTVESISPFVIGMGQSSIWETHLTLHKIYGVPYIPGSALKGASAHYCHRYLGNEEVEFREGGAYYNVLFGSKERAGCIRFHDALPTPDTVGTALCLDVMTPHHPNYNQLPTGQTVQAPRDDDSPDIIHFLAAKGNYRVALTCDAGQEEALEWLAIAKEIVVQTLQQESIGGKTNAGYGTFRLAK